MIQVPIQDPLFSSFSAKPPVVMQRTFIFPRAVKSVSATVTASGIATKNPLLVLESGQVAMLPRRLLEPRRPFSEPSKVEQQEGLLRYHPFLFPDSRQFVTLNQTVFGLDRVFVTPAIIESTTLVLATGLDVFFMRATPSKTFDLLAADFNHPFLALLTAGLGFAVYALSNMDRKKKLNGAWK
jgi:hypothetical protein